MSDYAWATTAAHTQVSSITTRLPALPQLLDADAPGTVALPSVPVTAVGDDEPLVSLTGTASVSVYARHGFPHAVAGAHLRSTVADKLTAAAQALPEHFGLVVLDAWRDPALQQFLYDRAYTQPGLPPGFVAPPTGDPARPTPHSTGGTVDLTLSYDGVALGLGTDFDEFEERAFTRALEGVAIHAAPADVVARDLRRLLYSVMHDQGFVVLAREWWHFEYGTRLWAAVTGSQPRYHAAPRPPDARAN